MNKNSERFFNSLPFLLAGWFFIMVITGANSLFLFLMVLLMVSIGLILLKSKAIKIIGVGVLVVNLGLVYQVVNTDIELNKEYDLLLESTFDSNDRLAFKECVNKNNVSVWPGINLIANSKGYSIKSFACSYVLGNKLVVLDKLQNLDYLETKVPFPLSIIIFNFGLN